MQENHPHPRWSYDTTKVNLTQMSRPNGGTTIHKECAVVIVKPHDRLYLTHMAIFIVDDELLMRDENNRVKYASGIVYVSDLLYFQLHSS